METTGYWQITFQNVYMSHRFLALYYKEQRNLECACAKKQV